MPPGSVSIVPDLKESWKNISNIKAKELFEYVWPNLVSPVPQSVFQRNNLFTVAGGFLVPGKSTGAISIFDMSALPPSLHKLSTDLSGHFYHEAAWWDVDGDGHLDLLSARASKPVVGPSTGSLQWFRNPGSLSQPWVQQELFSGPDVFFRLFDLHGDGHMAIVAAEFFSSKLSLFLCERVGHCSIPSSWTEYVIDATIGPPFDVRIADLNLDGHLELLVTNHVDNESLAGVFVYEIPDPITPTSVWLRHTVAQGFRVLVPGPNQAAPGDAQIFTPRTPWPYRPWIILSGDGAAQAYVLRPRHEDPRSWDYDCTVLVSTKNHGTVGGLAVTDVEGDGTADIFVPDYDHSLIYVFSFDK